jgi:hypothetical protein
MTVEKFRRCLRCKIDSVFGTLKGENQMEEPDKDHNEKHLEENESLKPDTCLKAPEWAEHARFRDDDQPCDDSRAGKI